MSTMKAIAINEYGGVEVLQNVEVSKPVPQADEVLVRIHATAVNPVDWKIRAGHMSGWLQHQLPLILGCEFSGVIEGVGANVSSVKIGDEIYGTVSIARSGAYAEYVIAKENEIAPKPKNIDHINAAALPVGIGTAWQAFTAAGLQAGQKVLIHAAAGGVGSLAVQLAKTKGAYVIGTASARNLEFVKNLGADEVIDYTTTKFEEVVKDVDVVFDLIGGETQERSFGVLKKGGFLASTVSAPDAETLAKYGINGAMIVLQPNAANLKEITTLVEAGKINTFIETVLPLSEARKAHELSESGRTRGKIILEVK